MEPKKAVSSSRPPPSTTKAHTRGNSFSSSTLSHTGSTASRSSNTSLSSTVGYGARPNSAMSRPNPSLAGRKLNGPTFARPATSLDTHAEDGETVLGKRKGMPAFSPISFSRSLSCSVGPSVDSYPSSLWNDGFQPDPSLEFRRPDRKGPSLDTYPQQTMHSSPQTSHYLDPRTITPVRPGQSSRVPIATPLKSFQPPAPSPCRTKKKHQKPFFLSKNSSVTNFDHYPGAEWDHDRREKALEELMATFMTQVNQQGQQSSGFKETIEVYKSRSK